MYYYRLLTLHKYLFIDYKMGLSMGKPTCQYPFPFTSTQNPKRDPRIGLASLISASRCAPSLASFAITKMVKYDQVFFKTWSRASSKFRHHKILKMTTMISNDGLRDTKPSNDMIEYEQCCSFLSVIKCRHRLDPCWPLVMEASEG
jgi:hypothetical protein